MHQFKYVTLNQDHWQIEPQHKINASAEKWNIRKFWWKSLQVLFRDLSEDMLHNHVVLDHLETYIEKV